MKYWWVNHNQTFKQEFGGGYLWSPKVKSDGHANRYYDSMRSVKPGDLVFSFADTKLQGIGVATSHCYTCPRPNEFGRVGEVWDLIGWRVDVDFHSCVEKPRPADHISLISRFIGIKHSPLRENGWGKQGVYLAAIPKGFASILGSLMGSPASLLTKNVHAEVDAPNVEIELKGVSEWEEIEIKKIREDAHIPETERQALVKARIGQGRFKKNVLQIERACRITKVTNEAHLIASHIKPWRESGNDERLAAGNGLLLTPTIDHLFDRGFISFGDDGETLVSSVADHESFVKMGVNPEEPPQVGLFNGDQKHFLEYHRKSVFLQ